jgi:hypothetical protein
MSLITIFVQTHGEAAIHDVEVAAAPTRDVLEAALSGAGIQLDKEDLLFLDEEDNPLAAKGKDTPLSLKHGTRLHISRCRKIAVTVHFLDKAAVEKFPPGARVRKVKAWAIEEFELEKRDAAEHVLQICGSSRRPAGDTPLNELASKADCSLCFDFVPEKRVEG